MHLSHWQGRHDPTLSFIAFHVNGRRDNELVVTSFYFFAHLVKIQGRS